MSHRVTTSAAACALGLLVCAAPAAAAPAGTAAPALSAAYVSPLVQGAIRDRYVALGGSSSFLGQPLIRETPTPYRRGAYNTFQGGSIYWSPATGAWEVHGEIRAAWGRLGYENSFLGFPTSNELRLAGGAVNTFEGGAMYFSVAGAHEVHGAILDAYADLGYERGRLGYPVSDERPTPDGVGRYSVFERGWIYWSPDTGANEIEGRIFDKWASIGWENSSLGYPVTDEYDAQPGRANDFEYGSITWRPETGALVTSFIDEVTAADTAADVFSVGAVGQDFRYDDNDEYSTVVVDADGNVSPPAPSTKAQFEAFLQVGAVVAADGYSLDPAGVTAFTAVQVVGPAAARRPGLAQLRAAH